MTRAQGMVAALAVTGVGWGLTTPLAKLAVEGSRPHGVLLSWNLAFAFLLLAAIALVRRRLPPLTAPALRLYALVAVIGVLVPFLGILAAAERLPAGILAVVMGLIPMIALLLALAVGRERAGPRRLGGLVLGLVAVGFLTLPGMGLPDAAALVFLPLALIAPFAYALEGTVVDLFGSADIDPLDLSLGSTALALPVALALGLASGAPMIPADPGLSEVAILASALINTLCYAGYLWLIGRAGPVFAAQIAYIEVVAGVLWSGLLLGETYPAAFWLALALLVGGLALVRPRNHLPAAAAKPL